MLTGKKHIHFIGIGGIGMSGLAKILKSQNFEISGCDVDKNQKTIIDLIDSGCKITNEHNSALCNDESIDILVHSTAIKNSNPEIIAAQKKNKIIFHRSDILAELMKTKFNIAVAGSHGKTTTTSLIAHILNEAKIDPTIIIGGYLKNISNNAKLGKSNILVAEADESDKSIEKLHPSIAIVTNIDLEHLETFKNLDDIKQTFQKFLNKLPNDGTAIVCIDDEEIRSILSFINANIIAYGIDNKADLTASNIDLQPNYSTFDLLKQGNKLTSVKINIPGKHNILNCLAAIAVCQKLEINLDIIVKAINTFQGVERRFSFNGIYKNAEIFEDYGHHPNEIINTLEVAKKRTKNRLNVIFQPHRYTRTEKLWNQFINAFLNSSIDNLIITDIYSASEEQINNITSLKLVEAIQQQNPKFEVIYTPFDQIQNQIDNKIQANDLILFLGAGNINKIIKKLI